MSETSTRRTPVIMEKTVLADFLKMYRSFPCLWDQKHMLYGNREARDRAYEVLLEKYKLIQENATLVDVKKKIEHMRCAYRREHKKMLMNQFRGRHYKPHLWYFDLLLFLNENHQNEYNLSESNKYEDSYQEIQEIEESDEEVKPKIRKIWPSNNSTNAIYETDSNGHDADDVAIQEVYEQDQDQPQSYIISNGADAFGRTLGFQLKELDRLQRVYAEKLISDVIFNARLGNLNAESAISVEGLINNKDFE